MKYYWHEQYKSLIYLRREPQGKFNNAAALLRSFANDTWLISISHENNWREQDTEYTDLDEAKAVAVALAAMQEKDT